MGEKPAQWDWTGLRKTSGCSQKFKVILDHSEFKASLCYKRPSQRRRRKNRQKRRRGMKKKEKRSKRRKRKQC